MSEPESRLMPHYEELRGYFKRRIVNPQEVNDLTQETYLRVYGRKQGESIKEPLRLLYRVARNLLIDRSRRAKTRPEISSLDQHGDLDHGAASPARMAEVQDGQNVELIAYSSATGREQAFNQTDLVLPFEVGGTKHEVLSGLEVGRQVTNNFRQRGFFTAVSDVATSLVVPVTAASISTPIALRQRDSDITNHGTAYSAAGYVQDQIWLSSRWLVVAGLRVENLAVDFTNDRTRTDISTHEVMASPRVGLIHRLNNEVSFYASHTLSYIPRAGEKLSSLTLNNRSLEPESFENRELGVKWDATPEVSLTLAAYQLDRRHVEAVDSTDPARSILVDGQRARGLELGFAGAVSKRWSVVGGYAYQTGEIRESQTPMVLAGAALSQLPRHTFSMWNRFDLNRTWGSAIGVIYRDEMFAAPENTVTLPSFVRVDTAVFYTVSAKVRAQLNLENVLNRGYASMAYNSNNITPGAPLNVRMSVAVRF